MAAVLSESVLDQNGPKGSKRPFWSKWPYSQLDFSIRETKVDQNGPFWSICPEEVHFFFGPFRSANRTLAIPDRQSKRPSSGEPSVGKGNQWPCKGSRGPCNRNPAPFSLHENLLRAPFPVTVLVVGVRADLQERPIL